MTATANRIKPRTDTAAIEQALRLILEPGQVTELRILNAVTREDRRPHTISGCFDFEHIGDLAQAAANVQSADGYYFVPNVLNPALLARACNRARAVFKEPTTADHDIERRRWLLIDCDFKRPAGISATDAEHQAAIDRAEQIRNNLAADGWPEGILADSGNGGHLLYRVDLPTDDGGLVERCLEALDVQFSGDGVNVDLTVYNPARIWKLYGTAAGKGDSIADRPHRLAQILEYPAEVYPVPRDLLEALAAKAPKPEAPEQTWQDDRYKQFSIDAWIQEHGLDVEPPRSWQGSGRKWMFRACPFNSDHTDRSAIIGQRPDGKLVFNCSHNSCEGRNWHDLRELIEPGHTERKSTYQGNGHAGVNGHAAPNVKQEPKRFPIYSSAELDAMTFGENAIIENVEIEGQPSVAIGGSKTLKTMLTLDGGVSGATQTNFLGCSFFRVPRARRVLIMSAESGLKALQRSARRIAKARGIELAEIEGLLWSDRVPYLGSDVDPGIVGSQVKELGIEWVIFDPLYLMLDGKDAGNLYSQGVQFRRLHDACREAGADFKLIHHTTRAAAKLYEPPTLNDASWAAIAEFAGQWWVLGRRDRYLAGSGVHKLWLELGARGEHQASWAIDVDEQADASGRPQGWSVTVRPAAEAAGTGEGSDKAKQRDDARERSIDAAAKKIVDAAARFPMGETEKRIRDWAGLDGGAIVKEAFARLLNDGDLEEIELVKPNRNKPYPALRLVRMEK